MQDPNAPESLRDFQINYGRYLRNPAAQSRPPGVPERRSQIYEDLLFNNISGFINSCFPVTHSLFQKAQWQDIRRAFFEQWRCSTPIFSQIPYEFVRFISERPIGESLPPWLSELLHYEWIELEVDLDQTSFDINVISQPGMRLNPTARLLAYQWPVHTISVDYQPDDPKQSCLVVYRDHNLKVRFSEVSPTTLLLLQFIQEWPYKVSVEEELKALIHSFAEHAKHPDPSALFQFAVQLLSDLKDKNIVAGDLV